MPRLRMSGAIPLLPLYGFIACTGTILPFISTKLETPKEEEK
jgi:hypothetical protein